MIRMLRQRDVRNTLNALGAVLSTAAEGVVGR